MSGSLSKLNLDLIFIYFFLQNFVRVTIAFSYI